MNSNEQIRKLHLEMISFDHGDPRGIQHFCKVYEYASLIGREEGLDEKTQFILDAASLTHDIGIHYCLEKYGSAAGPYQEKEGPIIVKPMLEKLGFPEDVNERVQYLIGHHHTYDHIDGLDYQILVEADFLVNLCEGNAEEEKIRHVKETIFKTETGKKILEDMFF